MSKATSRRVASAPARVKTAVCLTPEAFQRMGAACIKEGMTQSEVVELLINRSLSGYVVSVRGERIRESADRQDRVIPAGDDDRLDAADRMTHAGAKVA